MMTRKDTDILAEVIRAKREEVAGWEERYEDGGSAALNQLAVDLAKELKIQGGFTTNGNRKFNKQRFLTRCGFGELSAKALAND